MQLTDDAWLVFATQGLLPMYAVDVDFVVRFVPPMLDIGSGIRLTRSFELPFVPQEGIAVFSKDWEGMEDPLGYRLKEITWDIDRSRFLAETEMSVTGTPIVLIPHEIRRLTDHGWRLGSCKDHYSTERRRGRRRANLPAMKISRWDDEEAEQWEVQPKGRPKEYKLVLHAVVAMMVTLQNNCNIAYAMLKTGGYVDVPEEKLPKDLSRAERRFSEAIEEYLAMPLDQKWKWCERIQGRYPRLSDVVEAMR